LLSALRSQREQFLSGGGKSIQGIGDMISPGIIAAAVYSGHKAARELGTGEAETDIADNFAPRDTIFINPYSQSGN